TKFRPLLADRRLASKEPAQKLLALHLLKMLPHAVEKILQPISSLRHPIIKMAKSRKPGRVARVLAWVFLFTTIGLGGALAWTWTFVTKLALKPLPDPPLPAKMQVSTGPASPLQMQYQLNMPGRGEIFPALAAAHAADYWPVA